MGMLFWSIGVGKLSDVMSTTRHLPWKYQGQICYLLSQLRWLCIYLLNKGKRILLLASYLRHFLTSNSSIVHLELLAIHLDPMLCTQLKKIVKCHVFLLYRSRQKRVLYVDNQMFAWEISRGSLIPYKASFCGSYFHHSNMYGMSKKISSFQELNSNSHMLTPLVKTFMT